MGEVISVQDKAATKPQSLSLLSLLSLAQLCLVHKERAGKLSCVRISTSTSTSNAARLHRSSGRSMNGTPTAVASLGSNRSMTGTLTVG